MGEIQKVTIRNLIEHPKRLSHFLLVLDNKGWVFPGGTQEEDESQVACAMREAMEEARVLCSPVGAVGMPDVSDPTHPRILFASKINEAEASTPGGELVARFFPQDKIINLRDANLLKFPSMVDDIRLYQSAPLIGINAVSAFMETHIASLSEELLLAS